MQGTVRFTPAADPEAAALYVLPGEEIGGDFAAWFDERWGAFLARHPGGRVGDVVDAQIEQLRGRITGAVYDDGSGTMPFLVTFIALVEGSRAQPILALARDASAMERHDREVHAAYGSARILPRERQPGPQAVQLAAVLAADSVWGAGGVARRREAAGSNRNDGFVPRPDGSYTSDLMSEMERLNREQAASVQAHMARLTDPRRLYGSSWKIADYSYVVFDTRVRITDLATLWLGSQGEYEYATRDARDRTVRERGTFELGGDQLILKPSTGAARRYTWSFDRDPEMAGNPEVWGYCPPDERVRRKLAPDCFTFLYLKDRSGREQVWREDHR